jgi:hypothetical protein
MRAVCAAALLPLLGACDLPADPRGSLAAAERRGTLRVGGGDSADAADERALLARFARHRGLELAWRGGCANELLLDLESARLDVVAVGLRPDNPWQARVGFTRPWRSGRGTTLVFAVPPGENRLLLALDRFLHEAERAR